METKSRSISIGYFRKSDRLLVLGHVLIEDADKDHEIQAAHRLLQDLDLSGRLSTLDALHLQKTR